VSVKGFKVDFSMIWKVVKEEIHDIQGEHKVSISFRPPQKIEKLIEKSPFGVKNALCAKVL
jgi:hypothetical protein